MNKLIKKQEEEFEDKFCVMLERSLYSEEQIKEVFDFISKVRKETAEYVAERFIDELLGTSERSGNSLKFKGGVDPVVLLETKDKILKELN